MKLKQGIALMALGATSVIAYQKFGSKISNQISKAYNSIMHNASDAMENKLESMR